MTSVLHPRIERDVRRFLRAICMDESRENPDADILELMSHTSLARLEWDDAVALLNRMVRDGLAERTREFRWALPLLDTAEFLPLK